MSPIFRKAEKRDLPALVQLMDQLGYEVDAETLARNLVEYKSSTIVACLGNQVIGCLAFHILLQFHSNEQHMRIVSFVVDQAHRGKGIGRKLIGEAEKIAKEKGCTVVELTCAAHRAKSGAHGFYVGRGYKCDGEKVYFRKRLMS